jgi:hypothetical protein
MGSRVTRELDPATIEQLRAVLKPRRERYSFEFAMRWWAELALGRDPGVSELGPFIEWFKPPQGEDPTVPVEDWPAQEAELIADLLIDGPARRDRGRKRQQRRRLDETGKHELPPSPAKPPSPNPKGAGRPPEDVDREALLFLALIYREFTMRVPTIRKGRPVKSKGDPTDFERFASKSFDAIGVKMPSPKPADFNWLFKRAPESKLNKEAVRSLLWGSIDPLPDVVQRSKAVRKATRTDERAEAIERALQPHHQAERDRIRGQNIAREAVDRAARPDAYAMHAALLRQERALRAEIVRRREAGDDSTELFASLRILRQQRMEAAQALRTDRKNSDKDPPG